MYSLSSQTHLLQSHPTVPLCHTIASPILTHWKYTKTLHTLLQPSWLKTKSRNHIWFYSRDIPTANTVNGPPTPPDEWQARTLGHCGQSCSSHTSSISIPRVLGTQVNSQAPLLSNHGGGEPCKHPSTPCDCGLWHREVLRHLNYSRQHKWTSRILEHEKVTYNS